MVENKDALTKRYHYIDALKCFAAFSIVFCHCIEFLYQVNVTEFQTLPAIDRLFSVVGFTFGRLGVPIFLMVSGFLLLQKEMTDDKSALRFYKNNFLPLLISFEIWAVLYYLFYISLNNLPFSGYKLFLLLSFSEDVPMKNMWFAPLIIMIYFTVPFWAAVVKKFSLKVMLIPISLVVVVSYLYSDFNIIQSARQSTVFLNSTLDVSLVSGAFGVLLFIGYYIGIIERKINRGLVFVFALLVFALIVGLTIYAYSNGFEFRLWYNSSLLLAVCVLLFCLFKTFAFENSHLKKFTRLVSGNTLGIFFIHLPIIMLLDRLNLEATLNRPTTAVVYFILSFLLSLLLSVVLSNIKFIKRYVIVSK